MGIMVNSLGLALTAHSCHRCPPFELTSNNTVYLELEISFKLLKPAVNYPSSLSSLVLRTGDE
jgi:hypothetical protein